MKINFEYGDLVMYVSMNKPRIGKYVRRESGKMIIVPESEGTIVKREPRTVIKLAAVYLKYKDDIKRQTWSLQ